MSTPAKAPLSGILGATGSPALSSGQWALAGAVALVAHLLAAVPFLGEATALEEPGLEETEGLAIGVDLGPAFAPPAPPEPVPEPEPVVEEPQAIVERAVDSPPPAPPAVPREVLDLPDIQPRPIEHRTGRGGGSGIGGGGPGGGGTLTVDENLMVQQWLVRARRAVLEKIIYPRRARERGMSGTASVLVSVNASGEIANWELDRPTGFSVLDREVKSAMKRVRRLPAFPEALKRKSLTVRFPVRFELMAKGRTPPPQAAPEVTAAAPREAPEMEPVDTGLPVETVSQCAGEAATLSADRLAIDASAARLNEVQITYAAEVEDFERLAKRDPSRARRERPEFDRRLAEYNQGVEAYNASVEAFRQKASGYAIRCSDGSTSWATFEQACQPYRHTGNAYCEAFDVFWERLAES